MVYAYNGILFSLRREGDSDTGYNIEWEKIFGKHVKELISKINILKRMECSKIRK